MKMYDRMAKNGVARGYLLDAEERVCLVGAAYICYGLHNESFVEDLNITLRFNNAATAWRQLPDRVKEALAKVLDETAERDRIYSLSFGSITGYNDSENHSDEDILLFAKKVDALLEAE